MSKAPHVNYATVVLVHDGDTFSALVELDFYVRILIKVRVHGLFCAELKEPGGPEARAAARGLLPEGSKITIQSYKDEQSFTRWVCDVWAADGRSFADVMNAAGFGGHGVGV